MVKIRMMWASNETTFIFNKLRPNITRKGRSHSLLGVKSKLRDSVKLF